MKTVFVVILITIFGGLIWYSWPVFTSELSCYDDANQTESTINFRSLSSAWGKRQVCEAEFAKLVALNTCTVKISEIKINRIQKYLDPYFNIIFRFLRPAFKLYAEQKSDYNNDCQEFEDILIP